MRFQPTYGNIWGVTYPLIFAGISESIISANLGQPGGHLFSDFSGRSDGISGKKAATGRHRAIGNGFVAF